jgi:16S rRNA (uracil1498-N3)-methyltransferase
LFFTDQISTGLTQDLLGDEAHHASKVLRLNLGEQIKISDGKGSWVSGPITEIKKKTLTIAISDRGASAVVTPEIVLVQAVTKSDRNKEMLELAVGAGVDRIIPWQSERSISKWQSDSYSKWETGIKEACKQARQVRLPELNRVMNTNEISKLFTQNSRGFVFHESANIQFSHQEVDEKLDCVYLVIGPEGGITESELGIFTQAGGQVVRLGSTVLRSAHAGFAAIAALQTRLGRW